MTDVDRSAAPGQAVKILRSVDGIAALRQQEWPSNRGRANTYRKLQAAEAETQPRHTICGFCGKKSPLLDGPTGRAWFQAHKCKKTHLRLVSSQ